jgi:hypothetical protein
VATLVTATAARSGCADGAREGYLSPTDFPYIAACSAAFTVPGLQTGPSCGRKAGDDGPLSSGQGCAAADACALGWHLCSTANEVISMGGAACPADAPAGAFFATAQPMASNLTCSVQVVSTDGSPVGLNDIVGCGSGGESPSPALDLATCAPLNSVLRQGGSTALPAGWRAGYHPERELTQVTNTNPFAGGVLCCKDSGGVLDPVIKRPVVTFAGENAIVVTFEPMSTPVDLYILYEAAGSARTSVPPRIQKTKKQKKQNKKKRKKEKIDICGRLMIK